MKRLLFSLLLIISMLSCVNVKPYERQYLHDPEMQMSSDSGQSFNNYVHSIREGTVPVGSTKGSGGCGCN